MPPSATVTDSGSNTSPGSLVSVTLTVTGSAEVTSPYPSTVWTIFPELSFMSSSSRGRTITVFGWFQSFWSKVAAIGSIGVRRWPRTSMPTNPLGSPPTLTVTFLVGCERSFSV